MLRKGDSTAFVWMDAVNEETLTSYFEFLEDTLNTNGLQNCPSQFYNVNETKSQPSNDCAAQGYKKLCYQSSGQKGQITVVACGNATGNVLPPLIIYV